MNPLKLYGSIAVILALIGALAYGIHIKGKADRLDAVEAALAGEKAKHTKYVEKAIEQMAEFTRKAQADQEADQKLTARITELEGVAADLRRAASRVPATVEKADDKGVVRAVINPDWWLCQSAQLSGDAADTAACRARAGDGEVPN